MSRFALIAGVRVVLCICVLGGANVARAEPPSQTPPVPVTQEATPPVQAATPRLLVAASLGIGRASLVNDAGDSDRRRSELFQVDVGLRAGHRDVIIGLHLGLASNAKFTATRSLSMYDEQWQYSARPIQLGVTGQVLFARRFWIAPWLGLQNALLRQDCYIFQDKQVAGAQPTTNCSPQPWEAGSTRLAAGISLSGDVADFGGHRISIVASMVHARGDKADVMNEAYTGFWLGVGYRYWPQSP